MSNEDDVRGLAKVMDFMRGLSIIILIMHVYFFCYSGMHAVGLTHTFPDKFLLKISTGSAFFHGVLPSKLLALVFLGLSCLGVRGVKTEKITWSLIYTTLIAGLVLYFGNRWILKVPLSPVVILTLYSITLTAGYILLLMAGGWISRLMKHQLFDDVFNDENESFMQETRLLENESSVNLPSRFYYKKKWHKGWINVVNPYRATMVLGTPGSGKSFAVINNFIKQQLEKGFSMYIYDFKFPDLSLIAYNHLALHLEEYAKATGKEAPTFWIINIDDPRHSHRCNPLAPELMTDISDAYESAYVIMLNLNKTWIQKQGDFFVESPITLLTAIIWFLKIYEGGKYCTFPHAIEMLTQPYQQVFEVLMDYEELESYMSPFVDAFKGNAQDQLQGQLASLKVPISRLTSPALYWVMTGNDFTLDLNNPKDPKILVVGNNPDRQNIYSAALGLYNARIVKLINKKWMTFTDENGKEEVLRTNKSSIIIDELPTIYFRGLDNLIATARSNRVAACLGIQDFSQLDRDYSEKESKVIQNIVGNIFSGQVLGNTAETLSKRFGKILQQRKSRNLGKDSTSTTISTQLDTLIPASKISTLTQGTFVGAVADDFDQPIDRKVFHSQIVVDVEQVKKDEARYVKKFPSLLNYEGQPLDKDEVSDILRRNYRRIKEEVADIVQLEVLRIYEKRKAEEEEAARKAENTPKEGDETPQAG